MRLVYIFLLSILLTSCVSNFSRSSQYFTPYQFGDLPQAEYGISKIVNRNIPNNNVYKSKDAVWLLLDRATIRFTKGEAQTAAKDYQLAIEAIDFYNQKCTAEFFSKVLLEDDVSAYSGEDYEQILARVYFALVLLHQGDVSNAHALLRQAEEQQQLKRELYANNEITADYELIDNTLAKYLLAILSEKRGDFTNAEILYRQCAGILNADLSTFGCVPEQSSDSATVLVICHNGNAPRKISGTSSASIASAVALEMLLCTQSVDPAISSMTGIPIPILIQWAMSEPKPTHASIDGCEKFLAPFYDVSSTAAKQLQQKLPLIVARGAARFAIRRGVVAYANQQDQCLGSLADIGMLIANANTKADTRSWLTLPSTIDLARFDVPAGLHDITIKVDYPMQAPFKNTYTLQLNPGDLCVINLFNFSAEVNSIQIPNRFIINTKEL